MSFRYEKRNAEILRRLCGMHGMFVTDQIAKLLDDWIEKHKKELPEKVIADIEAAAM